LVLIPRLWADSHDSAHDSKDIAALAGILFALAFGAQYGQHLLARMKKIGPIELFEQKASELIGTLKEVFDEITVEIDAARTASFDGGPLGPRALHTLRRAHDLVQHMELSGATPAGSAAKRYCDLLFKYAKLAARNEDWWAARWALSRIQDLEGEHFKPFAVAYNLGRAHYECAGSSGGEKEEYDFKRKALACFARAAKLDRFDSDAVFWLAYVQDDLKMYDYAIANNRRVLKLRGRGGQAIAARYNIVISLIKKNEMANALRELQQIFPQDEEERKNLEPANTDPELKPLLDDPRYRSRAKQWLRNLTYPTA
jgi:tetratricopeptide (TPR) repeat protein